ncbi:MAG: hypothetical protein H6741_03455 [Alphaproteobacteria bacterium]|nr:hypothetical protein [Alphaproteobacteria bacterium]MCB9791761.1 hypothetical protein [Alphaproteobacteria bacterium]
MDDELIARFRDGDPSATIPVRNNLRGVAARVISAPQWDRGGAPDPDMERAAADLAMKGDARTAVALAADAMSAAARLCLDLKRRGSPAEGGEHLESKLIVSLAMERASANQAVHAKAHLEACEACGRQIELVKHALRAAATATEMGMSEEQASAFDALLHAASEAASAEVDGEAAAPAGNARGPRPQRARPPRRVQPTRDLSALRPLLFIAVFVAGMTWWSQRLTPEEQSWKMAALLPPERPPLGRAALYDGKVRDALVGMAEDGECHQAANVLHKAWLEDDSDPLLRWYEGLALVCVRDGRRAVAALSEVEAIADPVPFGMDWWLGQALLLDGQTDTALRRLDRLGRSEHPRAEQARQLAQAVRDNS